MVAVSRSEKYREKLYKRINECKNELELADVVYAIIENAVDDREDFMQIMDGLEEYLRTHIDDNYNFLKDVYKWHKPKYDATLKGRVITTPPPTIIDNIKQSFDEAWRK